MKYLIFGGSGFIGSHLREYLKEQKVVSENIYCFDIAKRDRLNSNYNFVDIRRPIAINLDDFTSSVIFNLAAVHTTPGHSDREYFETNVYGAENVCDFARENKIQTIVFTSSISPYAVSEHITTEETLPMPETPYGISKLMAEYIHKLWQAEDPLNRKLIIVRPGVVFGKSEGGNFTRLYKALKNGFFFYPGRKNTIKAAVYVKDVVRILYESSMHELPGVVTFNLTYFPAPSIEKICQTIAEVTGIKEPKIVIPPRPLKLTARMMYSSAKVLGVKINGIHPDRVRKLMISTNISGEKLNESQYKLRYSLREALVDWFNDCDKEGLH